MLKRWFPTFCSLVEHFSPFTCVFFPLAIATSSLAVGYFVGIYFCGFDSPHVAFDLVVVAMGVVAHINLHDAYRLFRMRRRRGN